jgi:hypothetical protein
MTTAPQAFETKDFEKADELRTFPNGRLELLRFGDDEIGRVILDPGWRWSDSLRAIAGTELCEVAHMMYLIKGHMRIRMADGTEFDGVAGQVAYIPPGHDAWVVGDEQAVAVDWQGLGNYARR